MTLPTEGQSGHLQKHADIDALIAGHTSQIAAGDVTNPASAAGVSLNATIAASAGYRLEKHSGVDPTAATECSVAIQSAIDYASANKLVLISGPSQYLLATGVILRDHADLSRAVFNYTGTTGAAVTVGNAPSSISRKLVKTPYVIALAKTVAGWAQVAGSVGVDVVNTSDCVVHVGTVRNFETGLRVRGQGVGGGATYCKFYLGTLLNNKRNMVVTGDASGYANQNQTFGGSFNYDAAEGTAVAGTRHILLDNSAQVPDGWHFHQPSLEGSGPVCEAHIESFGHNNVFDNPRLETAGGVPTVRWGAGSKANEVRQGVNVDALVEIVAAGATNRVVRIHGNKVVTAGRVLNNTDEGKTLISNAAAVVTYTLPSAAQRSPGTVVQIKNVAASTVTVNTTTDPIDAVFSLNLAQWASLTVVAQHAPDMRWITV